MKPIFIAIILSFGIIHYGHAQLFDGYTSKSSYHATETVTFYTKSFQSDGIEQHNIRDINNNLVDLPIDFNQTTQPGMNTNEPWKNGYNYSSTATWTVPSSLKSGMYFINATTRIPLIIKGDNSSAEIVIVCSTNTDQAYTFDSHYNLNGVTSIGMYGQLDNQNPPVLIYSPIMSFHRPIVHLDLTDGFLKWFYNSNYSSVNVISDFDMDNYDEIKNAKLLIVIGHSEYWTRQARLNFDKFVDEGINEVGHTRDAIILSGNTMWWQVRYQTDDSDPLNSHNLQMVCYKGIHGGYINTNVNSTDPNCDPLLETTSYDKPEIKYSIGGSMGSDWFPHGGFSQDDMNVVYNGFSGYKIILPTSPLLSGTGLLQDNILPRNFVGSEKGELDGTFITGYDGNGYPVFDPNQMGFYRGEIVGFDIPAYGISDPIPCAPICVLQKTCTSGKVINVNSNYWCRPSHFNDSRVQTITQNMIDLLLTNSNIFVSPVPTRFSMKPASSTVSYTACITHGSIHATPCGVSITDGYKVDQNNNTFSAKIEDCFNCGHPQSIAVANPSATTGKPMEIINVEKNNNIGIMPNPNNGTFSITVTKNNQAIGVKEIKVMDMIGRVVWENKATSSNVFNIDISGYSAGIYYVRAINELGEIEIKKLIKQ